MISGLEFATRWGLGDLARATPDSVAALEIPEASRVFLVEVGLPGEAPPGMRFDLSARRLRKARVGLVRLGVIGQSELGLAPAGAVMCALPDGETLFVNVGLPELAESLLAFRDLTQPMREREAAETESLKRLARQTATGTPEDQANRMRRMVESRAAVAEAAARERQHIQQAMAALESALTRIDAQAMADPTHFWRITLAEAAPPQPVAPAG